MSLHVRFEDDAQAEYLEAGRWYEARQAGLGIEFLDEIDATIRRVLDFPRVGSAVPRVRGDLPIRRCAVRRFPYHGIYLEWQGELRILAVSHDRRRPDYWKERLKSASR